MSFGLGVFSGREFISLVRSGFGFGVRTFGKIGWLFGFDTKMGIPDYVVRLLAEGRYQEDGV